MGKLIKTKALAKGFTLIEVLIALMIVSVALPALMLRVQSVSDNTAYMEEKTFAYWVAQNKMQELMLRRQVMKVMVKSKQNDTIEFGGREWFWQVDSQSTAVERLYRIEVRVGVQRGEWLATLSGFMYE